MKKINLKEFQKKANEDLMEFFLLKWKNEKKLQKIRFQSHTGSGKTVMMAQFVINLTRDPRLLESDFTFLWVSIGGSKDGDLASQSKRKFDEYYDGNTGIEISDLNSLNREKVLKKNEILFFNWSKIKAGNKDIRKLRREGESEITWDGMIERTHQEGRNIILIIDEAHREVKTELADDLIKEIDPRIILEVTATHSEKKVDVEVSYKDVVDAGLIKEGILTQTSEDFKNIDGKDLDSYVLELALKKRKYLEEKYKDNTINVKPLLMIQLSNDNAVEQNNESQKDMTLSLLKEQGVEENKIAVWLDKEKTNLINITKNDSDIEVLLFKVAPATGWDCPRAQVLLMYRETKSPIFQVQLLGRILRMAEGKKYSEPELNNSYLYTTYTKSEVVESYENWEGQCENNTKFSEAEIKKGIEQFELETFVSQRADYNDIGLSFQKTFFEVALEKIKNKKELKKIGFFNTNQSNLDLIVDEIIIDYDKFIDKLKKEGKFNGVEMSQNDIEKLYKKLCIHILIKQEEGGKFGNLARSWGILKSALNVLIEEKLKCGEKEETYKFIVNDLLKGSNSVLIPVISSSLEDYKPIRDGEVLEKEKRRERKNKINFPLSKMNYSHLYEKVEMKKCAMTPCYIQKKKNKSGEETNERKFINFLENNDSVQWWWKNGDSGSEYFSIRRDGGKLFFPDWFVKTKNNIWILETKAGFTAEGSGVKSRFESLKKWLKENKGFKGGIVKPGPADIWKIANRFKDLDGEWEDLEL